MLEIGFKNPLHFSGRKSRFDCPFPRSALQRISQSGNKKNSFSDEFAKSLIESEIFEALTNANVKGISRNDIQREIFSIPAVKDYIFRASSSSDVDNSLKSDIITRINAFVRKNIWTIVINNMQ